METCFLQFSVFCSGSLLVLFGNAGFLVLLSNRMNSDRAWWGLNAGVGTADNAWPACLVSPWENCLGCPLSLAKATVNSAVNKNAHAAEEP